MVWTINSMGMWVPAPGHSPWHCLIYYYQVAMQPSEPLLLVTVWGKEKGGAIFTRLADRETGLLGLFHIEYGNYSETNRVGACKAVLAQLPHKGVQVLEKAACTRLPGTEEYLVKVTLHISTLLNKCNQNAAFLDICSVPWSTWKPKSLHSQLAAAKYPGHFMPSHAKIKCPVWTPVLYSCTVLN